jgi:hypothetical protein
MGIPNFEASDLEQVCIAIAIVILLYAKDAWN